MIVAVLSIDADSCILRAYANVSFRFPLGHSVAARFFVARDWM